MNKIILAPDSFKGSMTSKEVSDIMQKAVRLRFPQAECISLPIADGGEGSMDAFLSALGGHEENISVKGPHFEDVAASYAILPDHTAVIEMAKAAGLSWIQGCNDIKAATTYGVGQLMKDALEKGCPKLLVALGGSATNDGGTGAAAALGIRFRNDEGTDFIPTGGTLDRISSIDCSEWTAFYPNVTVIGMCDVQNPLCGEKGASAVFAPQKGANKKTVALLDKNLFHLADIVKQDLNKDILSLPGAGAAGGMGGGIAAFFGGKLVSGINLLLDTVHFDSLLQDADLILTSEGKLDSQSQFGKAVCGIARSAKSKGVPVIAIVGEIGDGADSIYHTGITAAFSTNRAGLPFEKALSRCREDLFAVTDDVLRLLSAFSH